MARVHIGPRRRPVGERRREARDSLTAGAPLLTGYDLNSGSLAQERFYDLALRSGYGELVRDSWPLEVDSLGPVPGAVFRDGEEVVVAGDETLVYARLSYGWLSVYSAASSRESAVAVCAAFRQAYPASFLSVDENEVRVPITFWTYGQFCPVPRLRRIDAARWGDVERNYSSGVRAEVGELMGWQRPERDGQLLLWYGPPGTGKSWGLRALASEWAPWAEFHYITDPDAFFVSQPSYMIDVLLADSYETIEAGSGDVYHEQGEGKWRVLLLEDTGELLASDAKERTGQGLSRLLNVVDGMIGQGLRVLALITTNDEIAEMHPAVTRPGRCASLVEFGPLSPAEASEWLGTETTSGGTLAELYARRTVGEDAIPSELVASVDPLEDVLELARSPLPEVDAEDFARYRHRGGGS